MLKKKLRGKSKFLRKMNELMEIYSRNQDTAFASTRERGPCSILTELRSYMIWKDTEKRKMCFAAFRPSIRRLMRCANPCGLKF